MSKDGAEKQNNLGMVIPKLRKVVKDAMNLQPKKDKEGDKQDDGSGVFWKKLATRRNEATQSLKNSNMPPSINVINEDGETEK